ncbi:MAG: ribose-phosphate diphosphokinase [Armatimonadetes bacterium]|nr:ribose-phosphate diphosphokinase [Armatimonadota bacterium]NIO75515.1 ribose-phosphate diphosphokinase [Armatimonadota bacterium]NIO95892.1 ribose-phosphate diphosphokinase [Armatimonadota bacterium]
MKRDSAELDDLRIITGSANPALAADIASRLQVGLTSLHISRFADQEIHVLINESVRGDDVFVIQPTCTPASENLMELLIILDALKRASPERVTAVIPYYGYARQERKEKPREPITAKLVADLLGVAGIDRVLTVDLHVQSIQGFFNCPVDHLLAGPLFADHFLERGLGGKDVVVVSPDVGGVGSARAFADRLHSPLAIIAKRRPEVDKVAVMEVIGELERDCAIMIDDMITTGASVMMAAQALAERGVKDIYVCATHPVLSENACQRLEDAPIKEMVVTDTIPIPAEKHTPKLKVISIAPLLAEAIRRVHSDTSVSALFEPSWDKQE